MAALLAAGAFDPALLGPLRERFTSWQARAEADGLDPALATAIRLAADGLWFADFGQFAPPTAAQRAAVLETLIHLTKGA